MRFSSLLSRSVCSPRRRQPVERLFDQSPYQRAFEFSCVPVRVGHGKIRCGGRPLIFRPLHNRLIDFFIWRNLPDKAHAVSVQVPLKLARRRFKNPSAYLEECDGSPKKFDNGRVLTFAQAFPSDHCPLLM